MVGRAAGSCCAGPRALTRTCTAHIVASDDPQRRPGATEPPAQRAEPVQRAEEEADAIEPVVAEPVAPPVQTVDLNSFLGRDVPDYWRQLSWTEESNGVFTAFLPRDHHVFQAIEEYARASQELTPYTAPAGEKTRMGAITRDLDDPVKAAALGRQGEEKLRHRLQEGKKGGPRPPRSRDMQITAVKVVANPRLWEEFSARRQMFRQSLVVKDDQGGFEGAGQDHSERVPWSTGQRPDLQGAAGVSRVPGLDVPPDPDRIPRNTKAPSSAGEGYFVHGTTPSAIAGIQSGGFDLKYVSNRAKDGERATGANWARVSIWRTVCPRRRLTPDALIPSAPTTTAPIRTTRPRKC